MAVLVADRVDRPPTLFDFVEGPPAAPAREPEPAAAPAEPGVPGQPGAVTAEPGAAVGGAKDVHDRVSGEPTLDDLVVGAWEGLTAQAAVSCPLCEGTLRPLYGGSGSADPVVAGRCDNCGTTLS